MEKAPVNLEDYKKWWAVNKHHIHRLAFFTIAAILLFIVVLCLAPSLDITEGGKISLSRMQLAYGLLSVLIAVALYVWGVGNWSRFEPPPDTPSKTSDSKTPAHGAAQGGPLAPPPVAPAPATPPPATPAPPKGAN